MEKKKTLIQYSDGATVRLHNKRISFAQTEEKIMIKFDFADENANNPACFHKCFKGKVRHTFLQMSNEAMESLVYAYVDYKKRKQHGNI